MRAAEYLTGGGVVALLDATGTVIFATPRGMLPPARGSDQSATPLIAAALHAPATVERDNLDGSLCMWYPGDPAEQRWTRRDGPVALLGHIVAHLLREEWWHLTGE